MVEIREIKDNIFALTEYMPENGISVSSFLIMGKVPVLVETGTPYLANGFLHAVSDMVPLETVSHIFVTHEHLDHFGGLPEYVSEAYNASVVAHSFLRVQLGFMGVVKGVISVNGGETIPIGDRRIEVIYTPIETTGTVIFLLKPDGILFSGDYFGQLGNGNSSQRPGTPTDRLVHDIMILHEGLGYREENIKKYLSPLRREKIEIIAPSHGSAIRENVGQVMDRAINAKLEYREALNFLRKMTAK